MERVEDGKHSYTLTRSDHRELQWTIAQGVALGLFLFAMLMTIIIGGGMILLGHSLSNK